MDEERRLSLLAVPVMIEDKVVAVIDVEGDEAGVFSENDKKILEILAEHMSSAVRRIREADSFDRNNRKLRALHNHAAQLAASESIDEIASVTQRTLFDILGLDRGSLGVVEEGWLHHRYLWNMESVEPFKMPLDGKGLTVLSVRTGLPQLVQEVSSNDVYFTRQPGSGSLTRSELVVPVKVEDNVVAVINVESNVNNAFSKDDLSILELFAEHVASAFERLWSQRKRIEMREQHNRELLEGVQMVSSMVQHDLRSPLQTIMNASYMLKKDPERIEEMVRVVEGSVKNAVDIMENWRNQDATDGLIRSDVNLSELVDDVLAASFIPGEVEVVVDVDPISVSLDRVKMMRLVDNLVRNAVEAMPEGGRLFVSSESTDDKILLEISDTGMGISNKVLPNLFKPFYTTKPMGTGLGLAFCKQAAEAHGGTITVESVEGEGTTLRITLPR